MTEHEQVMAAALSKLQRRLRRTGPAAWFCTECGKAWVEGEPENHWLTCATGIARAARVACGLEPV